MWWSVLMAPLTNVLCRWKSPSWLKFVDPHFFAILRKSAIETQVPIRLQWYFASICQSFFFWWLGTGLRSAAEYVGSVVVSQELLSIALFVDWLSIFLEEWLTHQGSWSICGNRIESYRYSICVVPASWFVDTFDATELVEIIASWRGHV